MELTNDGFNNIFLAATIKAFKAVIDSALEMKGKDPVSGILTDEEAFKILLSSACAENEKQLAMEAKVINPKAFPSYDFRNYRGRAYGLCFQMMLKFGQKYKDCFVRVDPEDDKHKFKDAREDKKETENAGK